MADGDKTLWRAWRARRDEDAFATLVEPHLRFATDFARRRGLHAADADDVVQQSLALLAREQSDRPVEVGLRSWLGRTVALQSKMLRRAEARRARREQAYDPPRSSPVSLDDKDEVAAALEELPQKQREAVVLRFLHDMEYREMAHVLGVSENACRIRVHKAVGRMRERLGREPAALVAALPFLGGEAGAAVVVKGALAAGATGVALKLALAAMALVAVTATGWLVTRDDPVDPVRREEPRAEVPAQEEEQDADPPAPPAPPRANPFFAAGAYELAFADRGAYRRGPNFVEWYRKDATLPDGAPTGIIFGHGALADQLKVVPDGVRYLGLRGGFTGELTPAQEARIGAMRDLEGLELHSIRLREQMFLQLAGMPSLSYLSLHGAQFDGAALRHLRDHPGLRRLRLRETAIRDDHLAHVGTLTALEFLDLTDTRISDRGFRHLRGLHRLEKLDLRDMRVTAAAVKELDLAHLEEFDADNAHFGDDVLKLLRESRNMRRLVLNNTLVTDEGLTHLAEMKGLEKLRLNGTHVTSAGIPKLAHLSQLEDLRLESTMVDDTAIPHLLRLTSLRRLELSKTQVSEEGLARIRAGLPDCQTR